MRVRALKRGVSNQLVGVNDGRLHISHAATKLNARSLNKGIKCFGSLLHRRYLTLIHGAQKLQGSCVHNASIGIFVSFSMLFSIKLGFRVDSNYDTACQWARLTAFAAL